MPSVSPDGQYIVFVTMKNGFRKLSIRRFDGKSEAALVEDGWSEFPVW
jgi:Tol biopolymer transport system component